VRLVAFELSEPAPSRPLGPPPLTRGNVLNCGVGKSHRALRLFLKRLHLVVPRGGSIGPPSQPRMAIAIKTQCTLLYPSSKTTSPAVGSA